MDQLVITAETGRTVGSRPAGRLRREGKVPAVVYGLGQEPVAISLVWRELRAALKTEAGVNALLAIDIDGTRHVSVVKDIQRHPVRREVIHVDFLRVDPTKPIPVDVPIIVTGEAKKVAAMQGSVDQLLFVLKVNARPDAIPNEFVISVDDLDIGTTVSIGDVALPDGVTCDLDPETTIVQGAATRATIQLMGEAAKAAKDAKGAE